ncbi:MAG: glycosyltransferase [Candidatus Ornithospirochaeta sp.]
MKKILIVNNNMHIGGVQKSLVNLLNEVHMDYDITLFLFDKSGEYLSEIPKGVNVIACTSAYRYFGISQSEAKQRSTWSFFARGFLAFITKLLGRSAVVRLIDLTQRRLVNHYDVAISFLHSGNPNSFYGGCNEFVLNKVNADKKITVLHGDYTMCGANSPQNNKLYHKFDLVAACSEGCKNTLIKAMPDMSKRCVTLPNCHNFDKMRADSIVDRMEYPKDRINVLSIGRLGPEKGGERALKAVAKAKGMGIPIKYHIVGDGIKRDELKVTSDSLGISDDVVFYGNQSNPYRFLPNADLLLISSYHEAAPMVIDEAMCFGVPVLSTNTVSAVDMIVNRGIGWICENSQDGIDNGLCTALEDVISLREKKKSILKNVASNSTAVSAFKKMVG